MKKILILLITSQLSLIAFSQVPGVTRLSSQSGAVTGSFISGAYAVPDASAIIEGRSTSKGFLAPRVTTAQRNLIASPATGLLVYNTTTGTFNVYTGAAWTDIASTTGWSLTGNSNATRSTFLGTTNDSSVRFRFSNRPSGIISGDNTALGLHALYTIDSLDGGGVNNTAFGISAGHFNTTGNQNVYVGESAGRHNTTGNYNTGIGLNALKTSIGSANVALGYFAGRYGNHANELFINNRDLGGTADSTILQIRQSLAYGKFGADSSNQLFRINGHLQISDGTAGNGYILAGDDTGAVSFVNTDLAVWKTAGNAGTNSATDYIGTSDNMTLILQANAGALGSIYMQAGEMDFNTHSQNIVFRDLDIPFTYAGMQPADTSVTIDAANLRFTQLGSGNIGDVWTNEDGATGTGRWTAPNATSGTFTPIVTDSTNVDLAPPNIDAMYYRIGDIVTVQYSFLVDPTTTGLQTSISVTLPIAANPSADLAGQGAYDDTGVHRAIVVLPVDANNCAAQFTATATTSNICQFSVTYRAN